MVLAYLLMVCVEKSSGWRTSVAPEHKTERQVTSLHRKLSADLTVTSEVHGQDPACDSASDGGLENKRLMTLTPPLRPPTDASLRHSR